MEHIKRLVSKPTSGYSFTGFKEFDNHEMVIALNDDKTGLKAFIAIHSTALGPTLGGTRMLSYHSEKDAIKDVLNLSKAMSYKCALVNLPYGGSKGVIISNSTAATNDVLKSYAKMVENLGGLFKTGTDVGISESDVQLMAKYTYHMLGVTQADRGDLNTSNAAALGVFYAIKATLLFLDKTESLNGKKIAIKGVGKLGGELARLLYKERASIIIADIDEKKVNSLLKELPKATKTSVLDIHIQEVDIYAPCALGNELTDKVIKSLKCRAIVGGANNQLPSIKAGDALFQRKILYAPDYIANAGGLIYVADELDAKGFNKARVNRRIKNIKETMHDIFQRSQTEGIPTHRIADTIAREKIYNNASQ